ncbi:MAG: DUF2784 domain-containing protein [Rhodocyclaceae bacterium]|nr:DUF2784 domain-containing protein [Rhodocyclaceae bacterium]
MSDGALADLVLVGHALVVAFVVLVPGLVWVGRRRGWRLAYSFPLRVTHLLVVLFVAGQAVFGGVCPLTTLEAGLRGAAAGRLASRGFIAEWLHRLLFYDAPGWVFATAYVSFAVGVAWLWWRYPPRRRSISARRRGDS